MNKKDGLIIILAFVAGALVGKNWNQVKEFLKPYLKKLGIETDEAYSILLTFLAKQKEKFSDLMAEIKMSNEIKAKKKENSSSQKIKTKKKSASKKESARMKKNIENTAKEQNRDVEIAVSKNTQAHE